MEFASGHTDQLGESAFDCGMNIFVRFREEKLSQRKFFPDGGKSEGDRSVFFIQKNIGLMQSVRPRDGTIHILDCHALVNR